MFFSLFGVPASAAPGKGYCIYKDRTDFATACPKIITEYGDAAKYTSTPTKVNGLSALTTASTDIVVFIEDIVVTSAELTHIDVSTKTYLYLCHVECKVSQNDMMAVIRPGFKYTNGPISFNPSATTSITADEIKAITANGCNIVLKADMEYTTHDSFDSMFPSSSFTVDNGKTITYKPVCDSFKNTRLVFVKDGIQWGKTTFRGAKIDFGTTTKVIISHDTAATPPTTPYAITGILYFDGSWKDITANYVAASTSTIYVTDIGTDKYKYVTVTTPPTAAMKVFCVSADGTGKCQSMTSLKFPENFVQLIKVEQETEKGVDANSIVALNGDLTVANSATLLTAFLLTDDAKTITVEGQGEVSTSLDLRNPIWFFKITNTAGANLLVATPAKITLAGNNKFLNPKVVQAAINENHDAKFDQAGGIALTDSTPFDLKSTSVTFTATTIMPLFDEAKIMLKAGSLNINGAEIKPPSTNQVNIQPLPHETISISQDNTNIKTTLTTSGIVKFDETWNSVAQGSIIFPPNEHPMIETKYPGSVPPWLSVTDATQGTVVYVPDAPPQKGKGSGNGLSGGAIAGIVIACVVVVAVIVVVVLNATGVIHLFGKKKVEV